MGLDWCEHIEWDGEMWEIRTYGRIVLTWSNDNFQFCPICGKPRPMSKKVRLYQAVVKDTCGRFYIFTKLFRSVEEVMNWLDVRPEYKIVRWPANQSFFVEIEE